MKYLVCTSVCFEVPGVGAICLAVDRPINQSHQHPQCSALHDSNAVGISEKVAHRGLGARVQLGLLLQHLLRLVPRHLLPLAAAATATRDPRQRARRPRQRSRTQSPPAPGERDRGDGYPSQPVWLRSCLFAIPRRGCDAKNLQGPGVTVALGTGKQTIDAKKSEPDAHCPLTSGVRHQEVVGGRVVAVRSQSQHTYLDTGSEPAAAVLIAYKCCCKRCG